MPERSLHRSRLGAALMWCTLASCAGGEASTTASASVVDSARTPAEALERFQEGLADPPHLRGGAPSLEGLVERFLDMVEQRDSAGLETLAISLEEFAYLYYPTSLESRPPHDLPPGLTWMMLQGRSREGLFHALEELGGHTLRHLDHSCQSRAESRNTIWGYCQTRFTRGADTLTGSLFGLVIERDGVFKFVSYANKL